MFQDLSVEQLLAMQKEKKIVAVDVRSPSEYREASIPGALNIPLFNDEERAEIGTIYKQVSVQAAKDRGLEIVSAKLPEFIKTFSAIPESKAVFCWRGGMRSRTSATVLDLMGIKTFRLNGGVRAYRRWIVDQIETMDFKPKAYVLNGYTGSGKTWLLHQLQAEGYPVLDLEGMANHRGSIFGQIGLNPHNQKTFDSLLIKDALPLQSSSFVVLEAESKRIGKAVLPEFIAEKKEQGTQLFLDIPRTERARFLVEDYQPWKHHEECMKAFYRIKARIHTPAAAQIEASLSAREYEDAVMLLLEYYYDPRYEHTAMRYPEENRITLSVRNAEEALTELVRILPVPVKTV
ncbi:tRNA 2-selenouridine(34) synthase MnmH [Bacillus sp. FJAT-42376]|uniref:tRNA 2-selenouridine(34) synthase MnmH n=1 Tax=Bacillus sp. FJAT-42376 TaxID=2014076 RepID=UPI000F506A55|nr:tRNA 2-selenouridine(34) synthase MnmH [Bacillus sp. FJAT-42376]AZB41521.1 tRNA 2-selenouridine(34) synthase MnmH [Bacillus sp. FJAT-42376]